MALRGLHHAMITNSNCGMCNTHVRDLGTDHKPYSGSLHNSLTGNGNLRQSLARHPNVVRGMPDTCLNGAAPNCNAVAVGRPSVATGCTITVPSPRQTADPALNNSGSSICTSEHLANNSGACTRGFPAWRNNLQHARQSGTQECCCRRKGPATCCRY